MRQLEGGFSTGQILTRGLSELHGKLVHELARPSFEWFWP
jgi:hypothetical protein